MTRSVLPARERREQILDAAARTIAENGYEESSVAKIISEAGISKGAFYHHFRSKEALLHDLVERMSTRLHAAMSAMVEDPKRSASEKFLAFFDDSRAYKRRELGDQAMRELAAMIYRPANSQLRIALERKSSELAFPLMVKVLELGQDSGEFELTDTNARARMILQLGSAVVRDAMLDAPHELEDRLTAYRNAAALLAGLRR